MPEDQERPPIDPHRLYTPQETADLFEVNVRTVRDLMRVKGPNRIKSVPIGTGPRARRRIPGIELIEWLRKRDGG